MLRLADGRGCGQGMASGAQNTRPSVTTAEVWTGDGVGRGGGPSPMCYYVTLRRRPGYCRGLGGDLQRRCYYVTLLPVLGRSWGALGS